MNGKSYLFELKKRSTESKAYQNFQFLGLEIAEVLNDPKHKGLYIRLVKKHDGQALLGLAKDIAQRENVRNKGAYFMKIYKEVIGLEKKSLKKPNSFQKK